MLTGVTVSASNLRTTGLKDNFSIIYFLFYNLQLKKKRLIVSSMSRFGLCNSVTSLHDCCKKLLRHHQILLLILILISFNKKACSLRSRPFEYFLKYQYGSLTPNLRKKTPPRKPYCICFFHFI